MLCVACLQHVFVITVKNAIWRSKDGGSTFEDITERFNSKGALLAYLGTAAAAYSWRAISYEGSSRGVQLMLQ